VTLPLALVVCVWCASIVLYCAQVRTFGLELRRGRASLDGTPGAPRALEPHRVSVLKPLSGLDEELAENLESFAGQEGVDHEILFGVASETDPALAVARAFVAAHPEIDARIVLTDPHAALNPKGAQLVALEALATGDIVLISDSNVRVHPHYLRRIVLAMDEPGVGVVSNAIAGTRERTFGARLENLLLATHQAPGVITGGHYSNGKLAVTVGKSLALRRDVLHEIGGFDSVKDLLAEDFALGMTALRAGHGVRILMDVVENPNVNTRVASVLKRHSRWAKTRRWSFPEGYLLEPVLLPLLWATVALAIAPAWPLVVMWALTAAVHVVGAQVLVTHLRGSPMPVSAWWMEILRVYVWIGCYLSGFVSRHVEWRGHRLVVGRGARLSAATEADARAIARAAERRTPPRDLTPALLRGAGLRRQLPR
jgi:ceramide glucosyltransferase